MVLCRIIHPKGIGAKMKTKQLIIPFLLLTILLSVAMVYADMEVKSLSNGMRISNITFPITVNTSGAGGGNGAEFCNMTIISLGSLTNTTNTNMSGMHPLAGTTGAFANLTNVTPRQNNFSFAINTFAIQDANDYNITVLCTNVTGSVYVNRSQSTSVIVDNTVPQAPTGLLSGGVTNRTMALASNVVNANTTTCSVSWLSSIPVSSLPAAVYSGTSCSLELSGVNEGSYQYQILASDGNNQTASAVTSFNVNLGGGTLVTAQGIPLPLAQAAGLTTPQTNQRSIVFLGGVAALAMVLLILIIILVMVIKKKN